MQQLCLLLMLLFDEHHVVVVVHAEYLHGLLHLHFEHLLEIVANGVAVVLEVFVEAAQAIDLLSIRVDSVKSKYVYNKINIQRSFEI